MTTLNSFSPLNNEEGPRTQLARATGATKIGFSPLNNEEGPRTPMHPQAGWCPPVVDLVFQSSE